MKLFAFYLPQYYPIPENDHHWGKGFTEWRNVVMARKLFIGHKQPKIPTDLGFYDLRCSETIKEQALYARKCGINGFSFWHYWFGDGKKTLDKPANILLLNPDIDIEYYFTWVNGDWTGSWVGDNNKIIFRQMYGDRQDYIDHFQYVLPFFKDKRYYKICNKPVFAINTPRDFDTIEFMDVFNSMAKENGFSGINWVAPLKRSKERQRRYFDQLTGYPPSDINLNFSVINKIRKLLKSHLYPIFKFHLFPVVIDYKQYASHYLSNVDYWMKDDRIQYTPVFLPNWDNTPRYGKKGFVFVNDNTDSMKLLFDGLYKMSKANGLPFMLIKAWNEWAEGNFVEPDFHHKDKIGITIKEVISHNS